MLTFLVLLVIVYLITMRHVSQNTDLRDVIQPLSIAVPPSTFSVNSSELVIPAVAGVVVQSGNNAIRVAGTASTGSTTTGVPNTSSQIQIYNGGNVTAAFDTDGMYIKGNLGIGTTTPTATLDVNGAIKASGTRV